MYSFPKLSCLWFGPIWFSLLYMLTQKIIIYANGRPQQGVTCTYSYFVSIYRCVNTKPQL